jgi:hypothetical protein
MKTEKLEPRISVKPHLDARQRVAAQSGRNSSPVLLCAAFDQLSNVKTSKRAGYCRRKKSVDDISAENDGAGRPV